MSTTTTTDNSQDFYTTWKMSEVYQKVLLGNYMRHRELSQNLLQCFIDDYTPSTRILELGCSDIQMVVYGCSHLQNVDYVGIDTSSPSLCLAEGELRKQGWNFDLIYADFSQELKMMTGKFDVILAGFSLHHLSDVQKPKVLREVYRLLNPGGRFIVYDELTEEGEEREAYLNRLIKTVHRDWDTLSEEQHTFIKEHITLHDKPIDFEAWRTIAELVGFRDINLCYRDSDGFFGLFEFKKNNLADY